MPSPQQTSLNTPASKFRHGNCVVSLVCQSGGISQRPGWGSFRISIRLRPLGEMVLRPQGSSKAASGRKRKGPRTSWWWWGLLSFKSAVPSPLESLQPSNGSPKLESCSVSGHQVSCHSGSLRMRSQVREVWSIHGNGGTPEWILSGWLRSGWNRQQPAHHAPPPGTAPHQDLHCCHRCPCSSTTRGVERLAQDSQLMLTRAT